MRNAACGRRRAQEIWSGEYWAHKGNVKLAMFRKRLTAPAAGEPPQPVLFLVHGSSNAARSSYDLTVPGKGEYSMMNVFARYGYDVWTMDHDGYGNSDSSGNNSDIASGVEDLKAAMTVVTAGDRPAKNSFLRHVVRRHPRRGLRAGAAGPRRSAGALRLHLQGRRRRRDPAAAEEHRGAARQSAAQARRQYDPLDLHPRRASGNLRSRRGGSDHRRRDEVRRHHSERHLSRHGGEPAGGRSGQGHVRRC